MTITQVVGHDGSARGDDALALARALARDDAHRIVVRVLPRGGLGTGTSAGQRDDAMAELQDVVAGLGPGEELRTVEAGSVAQGLHELAEAEHADLIVVGPTHRHGAGRALRGGSADHLLTGCPCPMAVATPGFAAGTRTVRRMLLAFDGGPEAQAALQTAGTVAEQARATVDVVAVVGTDVGYAAADAAGFATAIQDSARLGREAVQGAVDALPDAVVGRTLVLRPPVGDAVVSAAADHDADLVVVGSRGHGALSRIVLGSVGRFVLHHATCSVLVVPRTAVPAASPAG
jgi:nucleotide-binding universal stress UspA family protein